MYDLTVQLLVILQKLPYTSPRHRANSFLKQWLLTYVGINYILLEQGHLVLMKTLLQWGLKETYRDGQTQP